MTRKATPAQARAAALAIVRRLRASGHTAFFAGGCVRDELLGLSPTDYDVATDATPERIRGLFRRTRAVRFAARLGFEIEPGTAGAIRAHARELAGVSRERIGEEMRKMLGHPMRARAVRVLEGLGLDEPVLQEPHRVSAGPSLAGLGG